MNVSSAHHPSTSLSTHSANGNPSQSLYQSQTDYQSSQSSITLKTAEGDVVTISGYAAAGSHQEQEQWQRALKEGYSFTETAMLNASVQMTVQGDLNAEELQDINNLLADLQRISSAFFAGDSAGAMQEALAMGDMGTVAELRASFEYTSFASSQYGFRHPLPAKFDERWQQEFPALASHQEVPFADLLQAQWTQIEDFLNGQDEDKQPEQPFGQPQPPADSSLEAFLASMKEKIGEVTARHPRLSPFTLPLARKALHAAQGTTPAEGKTDHPGQETARLNNTILNELRKWQLSS